MEEVARAHCYHCNAFDNHKHCGCKSAAECWDWKYGLEEMRAAILAYHRVLREPSTGMLSVTGEYNRYRALERIRAMVDRADKEIQG